MHDQDQENELKERDVLRGCPEFGRLLNDLKEL